MVGAVQVWITCAPPEMISDQGSGLGGALEGYEEAGDLADLPGESQRLGEGAEERVIADGDPEPDVGGHHHIDHGPVFAGPVREGPGCRGRTVADDRTQSGLDVEDRSQPRRRIGMCRRHQDLPQPGLHA
ncbi:hypothetical protein MB27_11520 [Actinoplanes utahensis]|uniref:Uncharacterized protein n=1 Tax=Actinoplanes utahensis TaxID=1869 RepID=A0A0A6UPM0_ACTUT|nr:hypothetical protein MB27_11520 [Actinoplanes utahensis]